MVSRIKTWWWHNPLLFWVFLCDKILKRIPISTLFTCKCPISWLYPSVIKNNSPVQVTHKLQRYSDLQVNEDSIINIWHERQNKIQYCLFQGDWVVKGDKCLESICQKKFSSIAQFWGRWQELYSPSLIRQDYTLYKYMNKSIQEFYVNFQNLKMSINSFECNIPWNDILFHTNLNPRYVCAKV